MNFDPEERIKRAIALFNSGYNCAQSVFMAYSDLFDLTPDLANKISVSFGGGMGRMREVCGTVSAMSMLAGFAHPVPDPSDMQARKQNYAIVQQMAAEFKTNNGSIICRELLNLQKEHSSPAPSARTKTYYASRPCGRYVADAARIVGEMIRQAV